MEDSIFISGDYPAGQTPHDIIEGRALLLRTAFESGVKLPELGAAWEIVHYSDVADLLTVLDGLWKAHKVACEAKHFDPAACDTRFRAYRDHLLCALALNEPLIGNAIGVDA